MTVWQGELEVIESSRWELEQKRDFMSREQKFLLAKQRQAG
jgi:hypothetical protein